MKTLRPVRVRELLYPYTFIFSALDAVLLLHWNLYILCSFVCLPDFPHRIFTPLFLTACTSCFSNSLYFLFSLNLHHSVANTKHFETRISAMPVRFTSHPQQLHTHTNICTEPRWNANLASRLKAIREADLIYTKPTLSGKGVKLTLRLLMSYVYIYIYIYGAPILDVSRSHTTTQHSR